MATPSPVITDLSGNNTVLRFAWTLTTADTTGLSVIARYAAFKPHTVYFMGTWGGATAVLEGGNGTTFVGLTDNQGVAISKTVDSIAAVAQRPEAFRPRLSVAGVGASVVVTVIMVKGAV